jgi:hypothetical protein
VQNRPGDESFPTVDSSTTSAPYSTPPDLSIMSTMQLLRLYSSILTELLTRRIIRSRNAPVGDLAEHVVAISYEGILASPSEKSWDVLTGDQRRLQVKSRLIAATHRGTSFYSPFRSWDFDACVFVLFDPFSYEVHKAVEVPVPVVKSYAREAAWVKGFRVSTRADLFRMPGAVDVTERVAKALESI